MGGTGDWPLSGESTAMIAMATTAGILIIMIGCQNLRKVKSKKKVKVFIMNNVFGCLLVKTLHFGTLSLVNNSFYPFDKIHYYLSQKYNFYTANWDLLSMYIYNIGCILGVCIICMYSTLCMYKIVHKLIMCSIMCCRKKGPNPPV